MMVQANYKIMKEKRTILLLGRDSSLSHCWQLSVWRFTKPPMPSGIATKIDMDQSGSAMVQAKHEVVNEKAVIFLLSGRVLMLVP